jgi:hypothetical protein
MEESSVLALWESRMVLDSIRVMGPDRLKNVSKKLRNFMSRIESFLSPEEEVSF